jgi:AcrR family transcriptional regulator
MSSPRSPNGTPSAASRIRRRAGAASPSRETILEAARRLYAASDYAGVTMRAVAREVGCRSPSLYHYFESKDEIFRALVDIGLRLFEQFLPTSPSPDPLNRLWWRFWRYYEFSKAHPEYFRLLFVERSSPVGDPTLHARVMSGAETRAAIETCKAAGLLPPTTDAAAASIVLVCAIHGAAVTGMRERASPRQSEVLASTILRLALDGVRAGLLQVGDQPLYCEAAKAVREGGAGRGRGADAPQGSVQAAVLATETT